MFILIYLLSPIDIYPLLPKRGGKAFKRSRQNGSLVRIVDIIVNQDLAIFLQNPGLYLH
jgi:hypothetical protein